MGPMIAAMALAPVAQGLTQGLFGLISQAISPPPRESIADKIMAQQEHQRPPITF